MVNGDNDFKEPSKFHKSNMVRGTLGRDDNVNKNSGFGFGIAAIICLILGAIGFYFGLQLNYLLLLFTSLLLLTIVVPLLGIITTVICFRRKRLKGRCLSILIIFLLTVPLIYMLQLLLSAILPLIYTPPALTSNKLAIYNNCIKFINNHGQYKELFLTCRGEVAPEDEIYMLDSSASMKNLKKFFSEDEIVEIKQLSEQLDEINCVYFQRKDNLVLFVKRTNYILPSSPGVLYSLDGSNPNEFDDEFLNATKPFVKIKGNWYMSRLLIVRRFFRKTVDIPVPKSLIDHSLKVEGLNLVDETDKKSKPETKE